MNEQIKIDQRDCWKCLEGDWPELHVCETKNHIAQSGEMVQSQSQQGIINPEKGSIINWAAVRDLLDVQSGITRKETLEEILEIIKQETIDQQFSIHYQQGASLMKLGISEKLQSLTNKQ